MLTVHRESNVLTKDAKTERALKSIDKHKKQRLIFHANSGKHVKQIPVGLASIGNHEKQILRDKQILIIHSA